MYLLLFHVGEGELKEGLGLFGELEEEVQCVRH